MFTNHHICVVLRSIVRHIGIVQNSCINLNILKSYYEHIQWLVERFDANPNITVESLHRQLNEVFQFSRLVSINCDTKAIWSQVGFALKLMRYVLDDYNNENILGSI